MMYEPTVAPTSALEPTETPTVEPTVSPAKTPAPQPVATALPATFETGDTQETGGFGVFGIAIGGILLLTAGFLAGYLVGRRKTA